MKKIVNEVLKQNPNIVKKAKQVKKNHSGELIKIKVQNDNTLNSGRKYFWVNPDNFNIISTILLRQEQSKALEIPLGAIEIVIEINPENQVYSYTNIQRIIKRQDNIEKIFPQEEYLHLSHKRNKMVLLTIRRFVLDKHKDSFSLNTDIKHLHINQSQTG